LYIVFSLERGWVIVLWKRYPNINSFRFFTTQFKGVNKAAQGTGKCILNEPFHGDAVAIE